MPSIPWIPRLDPAGRATLRLLAGLVLVRWIYGLWVYDLQDGVMIQNVGDVYRRLAADSWEGFGSLIRFGDFLPGSLLALGTIQFALGNLFLSPVIVGALGIAMWIFALAGITRALFPQSKDATILTVLLVAFAPSATWDSLTASSTPLTLGVTSVAVWAALRGHRENQRRFWVTFCVACWVASLISLDAWLILGPLWLLTAIQVLVSSRIRAQRDRASILWIIAAGLGFAAVGAWIQLTRPSILSLSILRTDQVNPGHLLRNFMGLMALSPLLPLGVLMSVVGAQVRQLNDFPLGKAAAATVLLLTGSVLTCSQPHGDESRLFLAFAMLAPLIAGGTVSAIRSVAHRPQRFVWIVWVAVGLNAGFSLMRGMGFRQPHSDYVTLGQSLRDMLSHESLQPQDNIALESKIDMDPSVKPAQEEIAELLPLIHLFQPDRLQLSSVIPPQGVAPGQHEQVGKRVVKLLRDRNDQVVFALSPSGIRLLEEGGYQNAGVLGPFTIFGNRQRDGLLDHLRKMLKRWETDGILQPEPEVEEEPQRKATPQQPKAPRERKQRPTRERPTRERKRRS